MPTVCPKDRTTPHRPHQTSDITQRESLPLSSDGILKIPDIFQLTLSDSFLKTIPAMFNWVKSAESAGQSSMKLTLFCRKY